MNAKVQFSCDSCGAHFLQWPSQIGGKAYCSRACYAESLRGKVPHNKGASVLAEKPCAVCSATMSGLPSEMKRRKYCSPECLKLAFSNVDIGATLRRRSRVVESGCWLWTGALRDGYGRVKFNGSVTQEAHRASYEFHIGPIPEGLVIDHLCRNRSCINPSHLEPVTQGENIRRGETGRHTPITEAHRLALSAGGKRRFSDPAARAAHGSALKAAINRKKKNER